MRLAIGLVAVGVVFMAIPVRADSQSDFASGILAVHNRERAAVGVPPVTWSDKLAKDAAVWADHLAQVGKLEHSPANSRPDEGENLWAGTAGGFTPEEIADAWASEKADYHYGPFAMSGPGEKVIGHYTQMIWKATQTIGCAKADGAQLEVVVCRYSPSGNWMGEMPY